MSIELLYVLGWFFAGGVTEAVNTYLRTWSVDVLGSRRSTFPIFGIVGGLVLRLLGTASILAFAFSRDVAFGVAALAGYWVCRWWMVWRIHRRSSSTDDGSR